MLCIYKVTDFYITTSKEIILMRQIFNKLDGTTTPTVSTTPTPTTTPTPCEAYQESYATECLNRSSAVGAQTIAEGQVKAAEDSIAANRALRKTKFAERNAQDVIFEAQVAIIKTREDDNKAKNAKIGKNNKQITENQALVKKNKKLIDTQELIINNVNSTKKQVAAAREVIKPLRAANNVAINQNESLNAENKIKAGIVTKNNNAIAAANLLKDAAAAAYNKLNGEILAIDLAQDALRKTKAAAQTAVDILTTQIASIDATLEELAAVMAASTPPCEVTPCD